MLEDTEETVQEDLEADGRGLCTVQHQTRDVKDYVWLNDLHL